MNKIFDKLKTARLPYVITNSHASYQYHRWLLPVANILELQIRPEDFDLWQQFFPAEKIYVSETPPTSEMMKRLDLAVVLAKNLTNPIYDHKRTITGVHYESPEDLCLDFLAAALMETTLMEALALLLAQRQNLRWDYFCGRVTAANHSREAGILLDVINEHMHQGFIPSAITDFLFEHANRHEELKSEYFPFTWRVKQALRQHRENDLAITYAQTSRKWGHKVVLPRYLMDKLVLDLNHVL